MNDSATFLDLKLLNSATVNRIMRNIIKLYIVVDMFAF